MLNLLYCIRDYPCSNRSYNPLRFSALFKVTATKTNETIERSIFIGKKKHDERMLYNR